MKKISDNLFQGIQQEYLKQIQVPLVKSEKKFMVCPIGLVGAGKTTVMKPLSEKLNLVRISGDDIRKILNEKNCNYDMLKDLGFGSVQYFLEKGYSIAIDSDCIAEETQKKIHEMETKFNTKIFWIHINPPENFIVEKLSNLTPNWLGTADDMLKSYYQRKPMHLNPKFYFTYVFDTSKDDINFQIQEAVSKINLELKKDIGIFENKYIL